MAVGIPAYRLPRDILNDEIEVIRKMGVAIRTGVTFGRDVTLESLKADGFKAVFGDRPARRPSPGRRKRGCRGRAAGG